MATALISNDCLRVANANELFAREKGLLVLRPGRAAGRFWFTIPSGCYALVTKHGADLDYVDPQGNRSAVWPAGLHNFRAPWTKVSHLVTKQTIVLDLPIKACKTKDNVTVNVDVGLAFRIMGDAELGEDPELVRKFVHQVKPRGLEQQLRDAQEEAVRGLARSLKHTEIYGIRSGGLADRGNKDGMQVQDIADDLSFSDQEDSINEDVVFVGSSDRGDRQAAKKAIKKGETVAAQMRARLNRQFVPQGVQILSIMIKSIALPTEITSQMTEKTMVISKQAQQRMHHQNAMQNNRMEQDVATMLQGFEEQRMQEKTSGEEILNAEQVKLNDMIAEAKKLEANIKEEANVRIETIMASNALEVQRVKDRMNETVSKISAEADRDAAELLANTKVETETVIAAARLQKARNEAKAQEIISRAEGTIAPWIERKKQHDTEVRKLRVYEHLAANNHLVISGSSDSDTNLVAVADAILESFDGTEGAAQSAVLAELALLNHGFLHKSQRMHTSPTHSFKRYGSTT